MPWNIGSRVEFQNHLSDDGYQLKRKCELFLFDFFIARNFMQFHFLLLHGSLCVKGSHKANNGKQRTRLPGDLSFIKTSSHKGHIRLKLVIIMIRPKSAKLQTPIKFFFLSLRASGMMLSLQMVRFQTRSLLRISLTLQFNPSRVY